MAKKIASSSERYNLIKFQWKEITLLRFLLLTRRVGCFRFVLKLIEINWWQLRKARLIDSDCFLSHAIEIDGVYGTEKSLFYPLIDCLYSFIRFHQNLDRHLQIKLQEEIKINVKTIFHLCAFYIHDTSKYTGIYLYMYYFFWLENGTWHFHKFLIRNFTVSLILAILLIENYKF